APKWVTILTLLPRTERMPSTRDWVLFRSALTLQVPGIFAPVLANGPITATVPCFFNGKLLFSFFNKPKDLPAASLASFKCSTVKISFLARSSLQYLNGSSNKPNLYFASKTNRQALLMSSSETLPSSKDFFKVVRKPSPTISISTPAFKDNSETFCRSPNPWSINSFTAV